MRGYEVCELVQNFTGLRPVTLETDLEDDLQLNEVDRLDLALLLEDEFDTTFSDSEIAEWETVRDIVDSLGR